MAVDIADAEFLRERNLDLGLRRALVKEHQRAGGGVAGVDREIDAAGHRGGAERKRLAGAELVAGKFMGWKNINTFHQY